MMVPISLELTEKAGYALGRGISLSVVSPSEPIRPRPTTLSKNSNLRER